MTLLACLDTPDEVRRLHALRELHLLDTAPSESFDRITRMAARLFDLPVAAVSLTDSDRQWFKSRVGVERTEIPRFPTPCSLVTASADVLVVEDIVDSGLTLQYLLRTLEARGPASLEVCALLTKPSRRTVDLPVRYTGFEIPDKFAIGYGLDYAERYRGLPYVATLTLTD